MKKVKLIFVATAILLSIGGAFATRSHVDCRFSQQFYWTSGGYVPAGQEGVNFVCMDAPEATCTFVQSGSQYVACRQGLFTPIPH